MAEVSKSLEGQLREARFQIDQLKLVKSAREEEVGALSAKLQQALDDSKAKQEELLAAASFLDEMKDVKGQLSSAKQAAALAEAQIREWDGDSNRQRQANHELMERLLKEQRDKFEAEERRLNELVAARSEEVTPLTDRPDDAETACGPRRECM